ncbi:MAG: hypothetical protein ACLP05_07855 [Candidatus Kryptoniota bacterium]
MRLNFYGKDSKAAVLIAAMASFMFAACAAVYTESEASFDVRAITASQRSNGGVVKIIAAKKINNVEAWLGNNNWLYITIPDTSISTLWLNRLKKNLLVEKTEFFRYAEAVQVTLKLREKMDHVEIIRYPDDNNIYIALFEDKSRSE